MEYLTIIICGLILAETTFLVFKKYQPLKGSKRKIFVDTSVLIDGRILNVARTGFVDGNFFVLRSVLRELQLLADGKDAEKRVRARAGLNNVSELERIVEINTEIIDDGERGKQVDEQLLKYAKESGGVILTLDYNLIKVAEAEGVATLNLNDLALATRTEFLPGEKMKLKIIEKGSNRGQGVGYSKDGTMVVVDHAANRIGKEVTVEFVRFHETSSGKLIFARIARRKG